MLKASKVLGVIGAVCAFVVAFCFLNSPPRHADAQTRPSIGMVQSNGTNMPVRYRLNFVGLTCADDQANARTTCTASNGTASALASSVSMTANESLTGAASATNTTGLTETVNVADGATSKAFAMVNSTTMTQGNLLTVGHGGGTKLTLDFSGALNVSNTVTTANNMQIGVGGKFDVSAAGQLIFGGNATSVKISGTAPLVLGTTTFAGLGAPTNGSMLYCSDCVIGSTCAGSGTGARATRINGAWVCN